MYKTTETTETIDMAELVKNHPLNKIPDDDRCVLVNKIREKFPKNEQQTFVANFYCYLNYDNEDFVINLDNIWKWIGFGRINDAKRLLVNNFKENEDYKIEKSALPFSKAENTEENRGGKNKELIILTIYCFKKLCLKTKTKKSDEIHDYYIKLEEIVNEIVYEQSEKLRKQLTEKNQEIQKILDGDFVDINDYAGKPVVYLIDMKEIIDGEKLYRIGNSGDVVERFRTHSLNLKDTKNDIIFKNCWDFLDISIAVDVETKIKRHIKAENIMYKYRDNSTEIFKTDKIGIIENLIDKWAVECTEKYIEESKNKSDKIYIEKLNAETEKRNADIEYMKQLDSLLKQGISIDKIIPENKDQEHLQKIIMKKETIPKPQMIGGIKCQICFITKLSDDFGINDQTLQPYANCISCRKKASSKNIENVKEEYKKHQEKQKDIVDQRQKILDQEIVCKCPRSKCQSSNPKEFGINKCTNSLYKVCRKCRGEDGLDLNVYDPNNPECTKCHYNFELIPDTYFKQCEECRQKWRDNFEMDPEEHEKKLLQKKEYYLKNREDIRKDQKEYYENNSKEIIQKKKNKSLTV